MSDLLAAIDLAGKISEIRETVRSLLGRDYDERMTHWQDLVRAAMAKHRIAALATVTVVARECEDAGKPLTPFQLLYLTAAAADIADEKGPIV